MSIFNVYNIDMSFIEIMIFIITISVVLIAISSIWGSEFAEYVFEIGFVIIAGFFVLMLLWFYIGNGFMIPKEWFD